MTVEAVGTRIWRLVFTGGPCGGKTKALPWIREALLSDGWHAFIVPELATQVYSSGVGTQGIQDNARWAFRFALVRGILWQEETWAGLVDQMAGDRKVLLCDRGIFDDFPYVDGWAEMDAIHAALGLSRTRAYERYDAVFHLVTAADGVPAAYSRATNAARQEADPAAALRADWLTKEAWAGHPRVQVFPNLDEGRTVRFEEKRDRLLAAVRSTLQGLERVASG